MPLQAVALKKNRSGTSPVSKISDNEHTAASLGHSEELSVKHSVGEPIPEFDHAPEYGSKVPSAVRRQDAGDVLPNQPSGAQSVSQPKIFKRQVATVIAQAASEAGDGEGLARCSADQKVNWGVVPGFNRGEVAMQGNLGIVMLQDGARKRLDLGKERRAPSERMPSRRRRLDAGTDGAVNHAPAPTSAPIGKPVMRSRRKATSSDGLRSPRLMRVIAERDRDSSSARRWSL